MRGRNPRRKRPSPLHRQPFRPTELLRRLLKLDHERAEAEKFAAKHGKPMPKNRQNPGSRNQDSLALESE